MNRNNIPQIDSFLLGVPKAGTTWLSNVLTRHPGISVSYPKEVNEVASHKGTFKRDNSEPNWNRYSRSFSSKGKKIDCSISAFACPVAPSRIHSLWPEAKFIVCVREPISRAISHWKMILEIREDIENGEDWTEFRNAWQDIRLRENSLYGRCMERWTRLFPLDRFLIIDSKDMKNNPEQKIREVFLHMGMRDAEIELDRVFSNPGENRRENTFLGNFLNQMEGLIPSSLRVRIANFLRGRGFNPYKLPLISRRIMDRPGVPGDPYKEGHEEVKEDLILFSKLTNFDVNDWISEITQRTSQD